MNPRRLTIAASLALAFAVSASACAAPTPSSTNNPADAIGGISPVVVDDDELSGDDSDRGDPIVDDDEGPVIDTSEINDSDIEDFASVDDGPAILLPGDSEPPLAATSELVASSTGTSEAVRPLTVDIEGLPPLNCCELIYVAWLVVDGLAVESGVFDVGFDGELIDPVDGGPARFDDVDEAEGLVITLENRDRNSTNASSSRILAGAFDEIGTANLTMTNSAALGTDFSDASGSFILATPTDGLPDSNELSGLWFEELPAASPSLTLPELPTGWEYESWVEIDGRPISMGRFTDPAMADDFSGFSATLEPAPDVPGEDFLVSPPEDLVFPLSLAGQVTFISVESVLDTDARPFALQPLIADIPVDAEPFVGFPLDAGFTAVSGTATLG